jgi:hypothetical protein
MNNKQHCYNMKQINNKSIMLLENTLTQTHTHVCAYIYTCKI